MKKIIGIFLILILFSCKQHEDLPTAQAIVDSSIEVSGGERYDKSQISFDFRDRQYSSEPIGKQKILKRRIKNDTLDLLDVKSPIKFERYSNGSLVILPDSTANTLANAVNSVHYFAYLPYGLNDAAVNKEHLGKVTIKEEEYYKVMVTFDQEGGGDDFDDVYIYWFNARSYKPDYLAYEFHVNGGGQRFREAFNERLVGGIRFVDYKNYKSNDLDVPIYKIDSLFEANELELLSEIRLENIAVSQGNYN
ncbi:DUF6503 family protein [Maribacter aestuarii]|uniref:DUF6503 family protein n=1 Tax=Maribacter aestuarii TaxID=1130723 RepID=UPI00248C86A7|nr:DUF6503 family protein [Maribacter aestuarii]